MKFLFLLDKRVKLHIFDEGNKGSVFLEKNMIFGESLLFYGL